MPIVHAKQGDHIEAIIRRFKRACEKAGVLTKLRKVSRFEKKSIIKTKAKKAAIKRRIKQQEKDAPVPSRGSFAAKNKKKADKRRR